MEISNIQNENHNNYFEMELLTKSGKVKGNGTVHIGKTFLNANFVNSLSKQHTDYKIKLKNVVVVKEMELNSDKRTLDVYYIKQGADRLLKLETLKFSSISSVAHTFSLKMSGIIAGFSRPKRLVVFINPISGRKKGVKIYREHMSPLCKLCSIECDVIVTNRRGQALEILDNYDLTTVDGIVTVGGDGIFSECVNGLLRRVQAEQHLNIHDIRNNLVPVDLPIGMIPAGSGNVLIEFLHGNKDIETAVLRIILGEVTRTNVAAVHQQGVLSVFACLILGFGLCGRMVRDCEKTRWMGPSRYSIAPLKALLTRKKYNVEINVVNNENHSPKLEKKKIVKRTKSFDVLRKSSLAPYGQHLTAARSHSLDYNRLPLRRKISRIESPFVSEHLRRKQSVDRTHQTVLKAQSKKNELTTTVTKLRKKSTTDINANKGEFSDINKTLKDIKRNSIVPEQILQRRKSLTTNNSVNKHRPESPTRWASPVPHRNFVTNDGSFENPFFYSTTHSTSNGSVRKYYPDIKHERSHSSHRNREKNTLRDRVYSVDTWIPTLTSTKGQCQPVFGDSNLTAHSVRSCSFSDHLKHLLKVNSRLAYCFRFDFVHSLRGKRYRVKILPDSNSSGRDKYYLNYDGDALLLKSTEFEVRLHRNIVKLFGTIQDKDSFT